MQLTVFMNKLYKFLANDSWTSFKFFFCENTNDVKTYIDASCKQENVYVPLSK